MSERLAESDGTVDAGLTLTFRVTEQMVKDCRDWSEPVRFRFEILDDGRVEMWLRKDEP